MNVSALNNLLRDNPQQLIYMLLPSGHFVPENFHITEIGHVHKKFVDCGGALREVEFCALQVWVANDKDHRVGTTKLANIMKYANFVDDLLPLMVEYGSDTITQYPVSDVEVTPKGLLFILGEKPTCCLAPDKCGVKGCC